MKKFIAAKDVAKIIRKELKENFKGVKFSVKTDTYAGGSSLRISYIDGPTTEEVNKVVKKYEGATFDGMQDLKENKDIIIDGEAYLGGPDFIFVHRDLSFEFTEKVLNEYGISIGDVVYHNSIEGEGCVSIDGLHNRRERLLVLDSSAM